MMNDKESAEGTYIYTLPGCEMSDLVGAEKRPKNAS